MMIPSLRNWIRAPRPAQRRRGWRAEAPPTAADVDRLEPRCLPAVDLAVTTGNFFITADPPAASENPYSTNILFLVTNLGTTGVEITGQPGDLSDNVLIAVYRSADDVLDASDSQLYVSAITLDNGPKTLNQNETAGLVSGRQVNAVNGFKFLIFHVDYDNKIAESNESNNVFAVPVPAAKLVQGPAGDVAAAPGQAAVVDPAILISDLSTNNFNGGRVLFVVTGADAKDRLHLLKQGTGPDKLRIAGKFLKLGKTKLGEVTREVNDVAGVLHQTLIIDLKSATPRTLAQRILQHLTYRPAKNSQGARLAFHQLFDDEGIPTQILQRTVNVG